MKRQHDRFLQIHEEDDFVCTYMEAVGHHEFGQGIKPVNFNNWLDEAPEGPDALSFWLRYWTAAYQFVLDHLSDNTVLLSYTRLTEEPETALSCLAETLDILNADLTSLAAELRPPRHHSVDQEALPTSLRQKAQELYHHLRDQAST